MTVGEITTYTNGKLVGEFLDDDPYWMQGNITGDFQIDDEATRQQVVLAALDAIEPTNSNSSLNETTCTDGRYRLGTIGTGRHMGVAEQLVGSSLLTGFVAAEALGDKFYNGSSGVRADSPIKQRFDYAADYFAANGELISAHVGCGGVEGLLPVTINSLTFVQSVEFLNRSMQLMPEDVYDLSIIEAQREATLRAIDNGAYLGYSHHLAVDAAIRHSGEDAVESLLNTGRGVHGHVEDFIVRLDHRLGGVALSPNRLNLSKIGVEEDRTVQAFGINGSSLERLALTLSNGGDNEQVYREAWNAMEVFTDSAHGTLANKLPTLVVRNAVDLAA
jgi:hypothetical protein